MKKISRFKNSLLLFSLLFIHFFTNSQITSVHNSWTTAYCNEEIGLKYKTGTVALNLPYIK